MRWRLVLAVGLFITGSAIVAAQSIIGKTAPQPPAFGTGVISGVVTDGATGLPLEDVLVTLRGGRPGSAGRPQEITDARGRFVFTHLLPSADYSIEGMKSGYLTGGYKRLPGMTLVPVIVLRDGEWFPKADAQLWRTASISGSVRDDQNEPVVGVPVRALVKVRIAGAFRQAAGPTTVTDDRGMYRFSGLSPGEYLIHVPSVQVTIPESTPALRPPAPPANGITSAAPDPDALVRTEVGVGLSVGFFATPPAGGGSAAYAMAYHPAARSMDVATPVSLEYGEQRQNVDVQLMLLPTVRVSGRVLGPPDALARLPIRLMPIGSEGLGYGAEAAFTTTDAQGAFTFLRVPSGDYTLLASRTISEFTVGSASLNALMPGNAAMMTSWQTSPVQGANSVGFTTRTTAGDLRLSGRTGISVGDRDVDDLVVALAAGVTVSGQFLWDGSETNAARLDPKVNLEPADGDLSLGLRGLDGRGTNTGAAGPVPLSITGVLPGRYVFGPVSAGQFSVEAIEWRGRDLLTSPLDVEGDRDVTGVVIRMTSKPIKVSGSVRDSRGPASAGVVITFPAAPASWRGFGLSAVLFRSAPVAADGTFEIERLVPGDYLLAAIPNEDRMRRLDPDYLASIAGFATRIHVAPGPTLTQSLRIIGGGR